MLQLMRDKAKSWVTIIIVAIIAFMMAITGLETLAPNPNNPNVATVNGEDITRAQLYQSLEQQRRMLIQQMGDQFDPSMIDENVFQDAVLQSLIDRSLQLQDAKKNGMEIGEEALDRMIVSMPEFQQNGQFDQSRFQMLVRNFGMTPLQFKQMLKEENLLIQLRAGFAASEFVTDAEMKAFSMLENQTRDIGWLTLDAASARDSIEPSDDDIAAYYEGNKDQFMTPEEVVINYVELSRDTLAENYTVDEDDINTEYQGQIEELKADASEKQRVSSILIETGSKRSLDEARARAQEVMKKLNEGADFGAVAMEYSDDANTSEKGGDMGIVEPGFFGDAFDEAISELAINQLSEPVETDYGVQILKVTGREKAAVPTLEQMRDEIVSTLKERVVDDLYLEKTRQLADISFEAADLVQPSEQLGLEIKHTDAFGRNGGLGIAANAKVIKAAFSDDVLNLRANSDVIEISPREAVVLRVKEHNQPELMPLDDVKPAIVTALKKQEAKKQLQTRVEELILAMKSGQPDQVAKEAGLTWSEKKNVGRSDVEVTRQIVAKSFRMSRPEKDKAVFESVELPNGDLAIIAVEAVHAGDYTEADREKMKSLAQYIATGNGRTVFSEYIQSLKKSGEVKILQKEDASLTESL